jgi:outer membrane receptor for ferrienterochelin and colicin
VRGGNGSVIPNLRGLLPKETLVLIDGNRAAIIGSGGGVAAGAFPNVAGVDINLIPFPMIDHLERWRLGHLWQRCGGRCVQYLF